MDKKILAIIVVVALIIILAIAITVTFLNRGKALCTTGGAVRDYGYSFIFKNIVLTCDCTGETIDRDFDKCCDQGWIECKGDILYNCYNIGNTKFPFIMGSNTKETIKSRFEKIPCPPNQHMSIDCKRDEQCASIECPEESAPKCDSTGKYCTCD